MVNEDKSVKPDKVSDNKPKKTKPAPKTNKAQEEFKKRYFEYYDDIKISDRQDW